MAATTETRNRAQAQELLMEAQLLLSQAWQAVRDATELLNEPEPPKALRLRPQPLPVAANVTPIRRKQRVA